MMKRWIDPRHDKRRVWQVYMMRGLAVVGIVGALWHVLNPDRDIIAAYTCISLAGLSIIAAGILNVPEAQRLDLELPPPNPDMDIELERARIQQRGLRSRD